MSDKPKKLTYREAGVDLAVYEQSLAGMVPFLKRTHGPRVLDGFGGFASLFSLDYNERLFARNYRHPVLISCTDGVGSKLKIAALMNKHDTVGIDLVAMSVNDALCTGGEPLLFLDYVAMPKDDPALTRDLIKGISDGWLEPTRIYVRPVKEILEHYPVKKRVVRGLAHITGEGLPGNVPRVLPPGRRVFLRRGSWPVPPVFPWLQRLGNIEQGEMEKVFNMGIGFVMIVSPYYAESIKNRLEEDRVKTYVIGEVREGEAGVEFAD